VPAPYACRSDHACRSGDQQVADPPSDGSAALCRGSRTSSAADVAGRQSEQRVATPGL